MSVLNRSRENQLKNFLNHGSIVMMLKLHTGFRQYAALIDTGADRSVIKESSAKELCETMGNHVTCSYFKKKVELTVGNFQTMILSKTITIHIFIKPSFKFNVQFIVVSQQSEVVIIGNNTLNVMKANIDYDPPRVTFKDGDQLVLVEILVHSKVKIHEDPLSSNDRKILQIILNLHAFELKFSNNNERNGKFSGNAYLVQDV